MELWRLIWVERMSGILNTLADHPGGLSLGELCARNQIPKGTMHRILQDLAKHQFVRQDPETGKYALGSAVLRLAQRYLNGLDLRNLCKPVLEQISREYRLASFLTVWQENGAVCVETCQANNGGVRYFVEVGKTLPLHASAAGKLLLAHRPLEERSLRISQLEMQPFTGATKQSIQQLREELDRIAQQGYAVCEEELEPGVSALSVPIISPDERIESCLSVVGPSSIIAGDQKLHLITVLQQAVDRVRTIWKGEEAHG